MCQKYDGMPLITIPLIANQALGALSTSFSRLERDTCRRGAYGLTIYYVLIRPETAGEKNALIAFNRAAACYKYLNLS